MDRTQDGNAAAHVQSLAGSSNGKAAMPTPRPSDTKVSMSSGRPRTGTETRSVSDHKNGSDSLCLPRPLVQFTNKAYQFCQKATDNGHDNVTHWLAWSLA
jgi:hypothetical protein